MKKFLLKVLGVLLITIMTGNYMNMVFAVSQSDLNQTEKKIQETKKELENIKEEKSETQKQAENLTYKISEFQDEIDELNNKISELNVQIEESQKKLEKAKDDYKKRQDLLEARLVATYEAGETSYLDVLLSSNSIADLISNYYLVTEVATNDAELLDQIRKQKDEIEAAKVALENNKSSLNNTKVSKESVAKQLETTKKEKDAYVAKLSSEEKDKQKELEAHEAEKREITNQLIAIANANKKKGTVTVHVEPSACGFIFPVQGRSRANISNTSFPSYSGHTGVDIYQNISYGENVVAVKDGTIITKKSLSYSYGEYVMIQHGNTGLVTLYAHMVRGSTNHLSVGQSVSQGQVIGKVGSTGRSEGTHLHFEVRENGSIRNPMNYLP